MSVYGVKGGRGLIGWLEFKGVIDWCNEGGRIGLFGIERKIDWPSKREKGLIEIEFAAVIGRCNEIETRLIGVCSHYWLLQHLCRESKLIDLTDTIEWCKKTKRGRGLIGLVVSRIKSYYWFNNQTDARIRVSAALVAKKKGHVPPLAAKKIEEYVSVEHAVLTISKELTPSNKQKNRTGDACTKLFGQRVLDRDRRTVLEI